MINRRRLLFRKKVILNSKRWPFHVRKKTEVYFKKLTTGAFAKILKTVLISYYNETYFHSVGMGSLRPNLNEKGETFGSTSEYLVVGILSSVAAILLAAIIFVSIRSRATPPLGQTPHNILPGVSQSPIIKNSCGSL